MRERLKDDQVYHMHNEFDGEIYVCGICAYEVNDDITDDRSRFHSPWAVENVPCSVCSERENQLVITRNIAKCAKCGDIIESVFRHHFTTCGCGAISVDGGKDYHRGVGNPEDFVVLTEEELAAFDALPTGRLENWTLWPNKCIYGVCYDDKLNRFADGTPIRTSFIQPDAPELVEGAIIPTNNSTYLLGKPAAAAKE